MGPTHPVSRRWVPHVVPIASTSVGRDLFPRPAPAEAVRAVVAPSQARSAVFDVLTNGTSVDVGVDA